MNTIEQNPYRILSIDVMRGLTLFLMLFVNDLYEPGVPHWLVHAKADFDGMGLADWVFPGFLFMVGMSVPYAIASRKKKGQTDLQIFRHILLRTLSLLLIGVLMLNSERINSNLSGIDRNLWAILLYISVFLIWNAYPRNEKMKKVFNGLKILGAAGMIVLAVIFKAGEAGNVSWFETSWWGILGLIGWGYFTAATVCLFTRSGLWASIAFLIFFLLMNMFSQSGMLWRLDFLNPVLGVIIDGNVPCIVLAGLVISNLVRLKTFTAKKIVTTILLAGTASLALGFFLRNWFIISKIYGTPSWAMVCNGISMLVFAGLYWIIDIRGKHKWSGLFRRAGENSLTTYLAPDVIYFLCWGLGLPIFLYKQDTNQLFAVTGSVVWAGAMICFSILLSKINIRLKL